MLAFFYSLFISLIRGTWSRYTLPDIKPVYENLTNRIGILILNTFGGEFTSVQNYLILDQGLTIEQAISAILSIVAMIMVCLAVFKLTKMVFSIFFGGR